MNLKTSVQQAGRSLSAMVMMPNLGAFIAWGLIAALFIENLMSKTRRKSGARIFALGLGLALTLAGCDNIHNATVGGKAEGDGGTVNFALSEDDFLSAFAKASYLTIKASADTLEAVQAAGVDIDTAVSNARAVNGKEEVTFVDLGPYIDTAKRLARSVSGEDVSLETRLGEITDSYQTKLSELVPAPDAAVGAGLLVIRDGEIWISDDQSIPVNSLDGIATIEVTNRIAAGEDVATVVAEIQADIDKLVANNGDGERGIYIKPENSVALGGSAAWQGAGGRWFDGVVNYHYDSNLSYPARLEARAAMDDWTSKTDGKVRFVEMAPNVWDHVSRAIGQSQFVTIKIDSSVKKGRATIGAAWGGYVKINPTYEKDHRVYRHELGHTLGLFHEHQRSDRDNYIIVSSSKNGDSDYTILPDTSWFAGFKKVKIGFLRLYIPYLWKGEYAKKVGTFDFDSVMLYPDFEVRPEYASRATLYNGKYVTRKNVDPSRLDGQTVKEMY